MQWARSLKAIILNYDIERTLTQICNEMATMLEHQLEEPPKALQDFAMPSIDGIFSSIRKLSIQAKNLEIKPGVIQMIQELVQFGGLSQEDPNIHIAYFLEICYTLKYNGVTNDAIHLCLLPFSLRDKTKAWLNSLPSGIITTCEELAKSS